MLHAHVIAAMEEFLSGTTFFWFFSTYEKLDRLDIGQQSFVYLYAFYLLIFYQVLN
jgi:hypothetical protein